LKDLFERLTIVINHLKLAEHALEEGDQYAARSYLYNAQSTIEQCRDITQRQIQKEI
jgi:hypothetical protein|tara:strand:+ start:386 stop:556 length:171 start_codon:yes stop_codon:yes gene_type:complete